jgi:hypothetical protein
MTTLDLATIVEHLGGPDGAPIHARPPTTHKAYLAGSNDQVLDLFSAKPTRAD